MNDIQLSTFKKDGELTKENVAVLGQQAGNLIKDIAPYLQVSDSEVQHYMDVNSLSTLQKMRFFRLKSCMTSKDEDISQFLSQKMERLFAAMYPMQYKMAYGITSYSGKTNLIIGVECDEAESIVRQVIEGLLSGIEITTHEVGFEKGAETFEHCGVLAGVPIKELNDKQQEFNISTLMRSLNGMDYTVLYLAKPMPLGDIQAKYGEIVSVRDKCFAVSKRNLANQTNETNTTGSSYGTTKTWSGGGMLAGQIGPVIIGGNGSYSKANSITESLSKAIGSSETISYEIQNGFALEMMEYCDKAIERLRKAQSIGMWETAIAYGAKSKLSAQIIHACLNAELAKDSTDVLPARGFSWKGKLAIPKLDGQNPLLVPITSSELGFMCTPPFESVPDFELKKGKVFPMIAQATDGVAIGKVTDGNRPLDYMDFSLNEDDLNKHTFVAGITGSGKTTTVKGILRNCKKPFMVIESAKKEYRNIIMPEGRKVEVYTLGKPEIHCLQFNPFYVQCGVNLQTHIDFLKDLFNASFSFYGPMPYILEKCLQNIYRNKGWNLTLGYHPFLVKQQNIAKIFDYDYMQKQYALNAHKNLFPTMEDLKAEVQRYVEQNMDYEGEVAGNVKTAILARLESMCVGSKGFMFNTNEVLDMNKLMNENAILELEGLPDDSDKAFCVGVLVIFIKEYRQVQQEKVDNSHGLKHLLVIEEAHRLLKNVDTERSSESLGNPKGKAVEHFTNMIAEMRSYGQGVIIAEQIPSKLAPDVIKNSSNKIIQRVVSSDDQYLVSNTIGLNKEDALQLGSLRTGFALCHKEGMSLPVMVKINPIVDNQISDDDQFLQQEGQMFFNINYCSIMESVVDEMDLSCIQLLNSIMAEDNDTITRTLNVCRERIQKLVNRKGVSLIMLREKEKLFGKLLLNGIVSLLVNGVYKLNDLMSNDLYNHLKAFLEQGNSSEIVKIQEGLRAGYQQAPKNRCVHIICELIKQDYNANVDIRGSIGRYFVLPEEKLYDEIEDKIRKDVSA